MTDLRFLRLDRALDAANGAVVAPLLFSLLFDISSAAPWAALAALALMTVPGILALDPHLSQTALVAGGAGRSGPS